MKRIVKARTIAAACVCLAVAGCGSSKSAAPPPKTQTTHVATATPRPTTVSPEYIQYAQLTEPIIRAGIKQVGNLVGQMQNTATVQMGRICVASGGGLSSNRDAFIAIPRPATARKFYGAAKHAYSITLGATDECGIAADTNSSHAMANAAKDLRSGLREMTRVEGTLAGWAAQH